MADWFDEHARAEVEARRAVKARARQEAATAERPWSQLLAAQVARLLQELRMELLPSECWVLSRQEEHPAASRTRLHWRRRQLPSGLDIYRRATRAWAAPPGVAVWSTGERADLLLTKDGRLCWAKRVVSHPPDWLPDPPSTERVSYCEEAEEGAVCLVREGELTFGGMGYAFQAVNGHVVVQTLSTDGGDMPVGSRDLDLTQALVAWEASLQPLHPPLTLDRRCPACRGAMLAQSYRGVLVDVCVDCEGLFVARDDIDQLLAGRPAEGSPRQSMVIPGQPAGE